MTIARHEENPTALAIEPDQTAFTPAQVAALRQIGVDQASDGDLEVFFHVAKRSGLDPFARQIHMVGRRSKNDRTGEWEQKYTIQTGIDGYRLIGRRAADRTRQKVSVDPPSWCDRDGAWHDVWSNAWGTPLAARCTIRRDGEPFTATALFDEYAQTRRDGKLNSMWSQRPAGQIAKCAEALAWRMAFPQDLSGIYTDDEMAQADNPAPVAPARPSGLGAALEAHQTGAAPESALRDDGTPSGEEGEALVPSGAGPQGHPVEPSGLGTSEPSSPPLNTSSALAKAMYAAIRDAGIARDRVHDLLSEVTGRDITSSKDLTEDEARRVLDFLPAQPEEDQ